MTQLSVIGAGSWGTALSIALAPRFSSVRLWAHDADRAAGIARARENQTYLPGFRLPDVIEISHRIETVASDARVILFAVPSLHFRAVLNALRPHISPGATLVSATKGLEQASLMRISQVIHQELNGQQPVAVLSGPTFAREIAAGEPAAVVIASETLAIAEEIQHAFATAALRFYASTDVAGVETGAALKNVIAIGAGVCTGLGLGSNSVAALITRGLAEITRLAVKLGGKPRTLSGLAGLGDLVLTATGHLSRNRHVGVRLGEGHALPKIVSEMTMVAEGIGTCRAAYHLGKREDVDLPIVNKMYELLYESKDPREAIRELMDRPLTSE